MSEQTGYKKLLGAVIAFIVVTYACLLLPKSWVNFLAGREMVFETLGSLLFLVASIYFFLAFRRIGKGPDLGSEDRWRKLAYILLSILLFVACGEELSWGQHLLGFEPPESIKQLNAQQELNLHNLWLVDSFDAEGGKKGGWRSLLNSNRLFDYFMVTLLWILPWAHALQPALARFIDRFGGPVVPRSLGLALAVSFGLTVLTELLIVDGMVLHLAVSEIRELSYALLCAVSARLLWQKEAAEAC